MILNYLAAGLLFASTAGQDSSSARYKCAYNLDEMLALDWRTFDQDPARGWRAIASRSGCDEAAADLIQRYRTMHADERLYWHEGQLRAFSGQYGRAIELFTLARRETRSGWNLYVDATIAFLRNDRRALLEARRRLAALEVPVDYEWSDLDGEIRRGRPPGWPYNLDVIDGLIRCFGRPYREAYSSSECRQPAR